MTTKLDVRSLAPTIGAEIRGVDCADVDDETVAAIRAVSLPAVGGDTMWSSSRAAYDALHGPLREFCDTLVAIHHDASYAARVANGESNLWDGAKLERRDPIEHPVVRVRPEIGRRSLFVNPGFTRGLRGDRPVGPEA